MKIWMVLLFWSGTAALLQAIPPGWSADLEAAMKQAGPERPVVLYFTAGWCGPCRQMAATTFQQPEVQRALKSVLPVALDLDDRPAEAERYGITSIPVFLVLGPEGSVVSRASGYQDAAQWLAWLGKGTQAHREALQEAATLAREAEDLSKRLVSVDPAERQRAVNTLLDWCASRQAFRRERAARELKQIAGRDPLLLAGGLTHPRLATRIETDRLLRERLGRDLDYDPWEGAAVREQKAAAVRAALVSP
jgi:thioredoxin-like negative regulator of GroEL